MSSCSAVKNLHIFTWINLFCFIYAVPPDVQVLVTPPQTTSCGGNVTLNCDVESLSQLEIKHLSWVAANKNCRYEEPKSGCESRKSERTHRLTLTLSNIWPIDAGNYSCKMRSNMEAMSRTTSVTVTECSGRPASSVNRSHAQCSFSGVYPSGSVHWFKGDANLTDSTTTEEEEDQCGAYNIWSVMDLQEVKLPLNCSLWIPALGKYVSEQPLRDSAASLIQLWWFCLLTGSILVTSGL
ncbi:uncharacterized protein LOC111582743 [Amphiprion ocellaris]|uniref:uncharacterized protein LOC111582743 n=1 Tax=Amphiprion ocellaris TaxID=80972 RepID=UPI000C31A48F|nr:uncharacterized protein LOC111582743 [Amphiprion ocellaris]